ncbi:MAG: 16S rRNA (cytosine(1402)-N(4))-methyltransferase, partial [Synergistaceae bacterium]|nr:16S rRNA (cytosine(1402)-N(4))-methyltransferase [Synergistaceae bacterium]
MQHEPVMLNEVLDFIKNYPHKKILDGTLGLGGHTKILLSALGPKGRIFGFDKDANAIEMAKE